MQMPWNSKKKEDSKQSPNPLYHDKSASELENSLKYTPKSEFIYNTEIKDTSKLTEQEKNKLIAKLYQNDYEKSKEIELLRGQNTKYLCFIKNLQKKETMRA